MNSDFCEFLRYESCEFTMALFLNLESQWEQKIAGFHSNGAQWENFLNLARILRVKSVYQSRCTYKYIWSDPN